MASASSSASLAPPVGFKDHCSILHNDVLYVYQPDAFQTLELKEGAEWKQETNGVAVSGAVCVKGGVDGNSDKPALYVVGGTTNTTTTNYTGLQRYSIEDKTWTTITPLVSVTSQRQYHGATYLNASSALLVYGGSQNGNAGPSTETFLMLMYPPYRIQSYSSAAPPAVNPILLPWSESEAIMVGGSATNQKIFKFHPDPGWTDLGLALPAPLPDKSVAQSSLVGLDDNSKLLITYDTSQSPNVVRRNVLLNAGGLPAIFNQPIGEPTSSAAQPSATASRMFKRATFLNNYPAYNSSSAPSTTRTNFALAQGQNDLTAIVGGDSDNTIQFFNKLANSWEPPSAFVGSVQQPLTSSNRVVPSPTSSSSPSDTATSTSSPAAVPDSNSSNGLQLLGGVLGGVCGIAAILIILLLWLRSVRRRKQDEEAQKNKQVSENKPSFEEQGLQPLSRQAQPMGRSPVPSAVLEDRDSVAMFGPRNEKGLDPGMIHKSQLGLHSNSNGSGIGFGFKREKSPLQISKPMMPDLGDYQVRPSIELGKATPITPTVAVDTGLMTALPDNSENNKADQRKTDEGWAKYFSSEKEVVVKRDTTLTENTNNTASAYIPSRSGKSAFWPGSGVSETATRSPNKGIFRDSEGRRLTAQKVAASSPNLTSGATDMRTQTMSTAQGIQAKISSGDSISTDVTDDDDYEDERMTAYSSGVPDSVHETNWTPMNNSWGGAPPGPLRPTSTQIISQDFPAPTNVSNTTTNTESTKSSLPNFPMPATTIRRVQPSAPGLSFAPGTRLSSSSSAYGSRIASEDYFGRSVHIATTSTPQPEPPRNQALHHPSEAPQLAPPQSDPTDMSWINLGTPAAGPPSTHQNSPDPNMPHQ